MKKVKKVQYISEDFLSPKDAWSKLSLEEKSDVIRQGVENGMSQLADIKKTYNNYMKDALDRVNTSEAPFVERLKDPDRKSIKDWEQPGAITTHKLSVGTDENNNHYIYPQVQEVNSQLVDYSRPPYSPFAGMISAEERGDTVRVPSIDEGLAFTEHYKNFYPKGNTFKGGGLMLGPINPLISLVSAIENRKKQKEEQRKQDAINNDFTNSEIKPLPFEDMIAKNIEKVDVKGMQSADAENYLRGLDTEQLKAVQREIADFGGYNKELRGNKEYIKKVQRELIENGYLDNSLRKDGSYREVDGIVGNKTQTAYNKYIGDLNVDGKLGSKTINGYLEMVSPSNKWKRDVSTSGVNGCAQWVTMKYEDAVGLQSLQNGVIGDAWQMPKNIESKGGDILYNLYDDDFNNVKTPKDLKALTEQKLKENPLDYSKIKIGDIVGIYMPSSNMISTAMKEGTTKNTHVGIVTGFDKDGTPIVEHNIHGSHRHDKISNLTGSVVGQAQVTVVARPKNTGSVVGEIPIKEKESRFKLADEYNNKNMTSYMNAMEGVSDVVQTLYPNIDINEAMIAAIAPLKRETNFMNNTVENLSKVDQLKKKAGNAVRKMKGMTDSTKSSNLTKMKLNSLTDSERRLIGIKTPKDLEDPRKAGAAALLLAARHLDYFNKLANTYPELGITEEDAFNATILAYNQGMSKLKSIGFNASGVKPEELEQLRTLSNPNTRIKDISSTNYKYLGILGDMIYDKFGSSYTPYVGAAHDAIDKYIKPSQDGLFSIK